MSASLFLLCKLSSFTSYFRFCIQVISHGICLSLSDLPSMTLSGCIHVAANTIIPFFRMAQWWPAVHRRRACSAHSRLWTLGSLPSLGCCQQCCCEHRCVCLSELEFSSTTNQIHQFFNTKPLWPNSHIHT